MDEKTIRLLEELRNELNNAKSLTEGDIRLREQLLQDIAGLMVRSGEAEAEEDQPILDRLKDAVERFEVTHPSLSAGTARVINALVNMGV